ncbi:MBL fold metallo-hydrolase [Paenibacillus chungangensis]|uniref:MBL fold metallo-hydrolase n=1 Tax=Paenibacillus chungangensis TaxID=696535 RepID=A0ABW3HP90_9BACL
MQITMLGTGSAFAKKYYNNNALVETDGCRLLVDCGITLPTALHKKGLQFDALDGVLISHMHGDHVGGLEEYAFQMLFKYGRKPLLYIADTLVEPLWEQTLRGGLTQGDLTSLEDFFVVKPLVPGQYYTLAPDLKVKLIQTKHIPNKDSYSFLFNDSFFYSADMKFDGELVMQLIENGVTTVYHDCQLEQPGMVHATLDELLTLPEDVQKKVWLMHYGDAMDDYRGRTGLMRIVEQGVAYSV